MKYYYIYKITNRINGRFYIGQHTTSNLEDGYMGSGKVLQLAYEKYGTENFQKKILKMCSSKDELDIIERRLVNNVFLSKTKMCYNINPGGAGGFAKGLWLGKTRSEKTKRRMSEAQKGHTLRQCSRDKISIANKGRHRSAETIEKQRATLKTTLAKQGVWNKGKKCPQLSGENNGGAKKFKGTHYYNNGIVEIRAKECPEGFVKGGLSKQRKV